jgi:hypothetical protein
VRPELTKDECLRELSKQAAKDEFTALVIGFEQETRFVWSGTLDAPLRLDTLLSAGGKPIGVLGANVVANAVVYRLEPLPPYDTQEWVPPYLAGVGDTVMEIFKQRWENARN